MRRRYRASSDSAQHFTSGSKKSIMRCVGKSGEKWGTKLAIREEQALLEG